MEDAFSQIGRMQIRALPLHSGESGTAKICTHEASLGHDRVGQNRSSKIGPEKLRPVGPRPPPCTTREKSVREIRFRERSFAKRQRIEISAVQAGSG